MKTFILILIALFIFLVLAYVIWNYFRVVSSEDLPRNDKIENNPIDKVPVQLPPRDSCGEECENRCLRDIENGIKIYGTECLEKCLKKCKG